MVDGAPVQLVVAKVTKQGEGSVTVQDLNMEEKNVRVSRFKQNNAGLWRGIVQVRTRSYFCLNFYSKIAVIFSIKN